MTFPELEVWIEAHVPQTKLLHGLAGQLVAIATLWMGLPLSIGLVVAVGAGKEIWDSFHPATDSCTLSSFLATVAGGVPIWGLWLVLRHGAV